MLKLAMTEQTGELRGIGTRRMSRRALLQGAAAGAIGAAAVLASGKLGIPKLLDYLEEIGSGVNGKFLRCQEDGTLVISDTPQVVKVKYTPHSDPTSRYWNKDNIIVHRNPVADIAEGKDILPEEIKTQYAIRVAGGAYEGQTGAARFEINYKGQNYTIGEWFAPSDQQGIPVNPNSELLQKDEKPYFIAANFVTVDKLANPSQ